MYFHDVLHMLLYSTPLTFAAHVSRLCYKTSFLTSAFIMADISKAIRTLGVVHLQSENAA
jgi:hypothetical protein